MSIQRTKNENQLQIQQSVIEKQVNGDKQLLQRMQRHDLEGALRKFAYDKIVLERQTTDQQKEIKSLSGQINELINDNLHLATISQEQAQSISILEQTSTSQASPDNAMNDLQIQELKQQASEMESIIQGYQEQIIQSQKKTTNLLIYEEKFADSLNDIHRVIRENDMLNMTIESKTQQIVSLQKQIQLLKQGNLKTKAQTDNQVLLEKEWIQLEKERHIKNKKIAELQHVINQQKNKIQGQKERTHTFMLKQNEELSELQLTCQQQFQTSSEEITELKLVIENQSSSLCAKQKENDECKAQLKGLEERLNKKICYIEEIRQNYKNELEKERLKVELKEDKIKVIQEAKKHLEEENSQFQAELIKIREENQGEIEKLRNVKIDFEILTDQFRIAKNDFAEKQTQNELRIFEFTEMQNVAKNQLKSMEDKLTSKEMEKNYEVIDIRQEYKKKISKIIEQTIEQIANEEGGEKVEMIKAEYEKRITELGQQLEGIKLKAKENLEIVADDYEKKINVLSNQLEITRATVRDVEKSSVYRKEYEINLNKFRQQLDIEGKSNEKLKLDIFNSNERVNFLESNVKRLSQELIKLNELNERLLMQSENMSTQILPLQKLNQKLLSNIDLESKDKNKIIKEYEMKENQTKKRIKITKFLLQNEIQRLHLQLEKYKSHIRKMMGTKLDIITEEENEEDSSKKN